MNSWCSPSFPLGTNTSPPHNLGRTFQSAVVLLSLHTYTNICVFAHPYAPMYAYLCYETTVYIYYEVYIQMQVFFCILSSVLRRRLTQGHFFSHINSYLDPCFQFTIARYWSFCFQAIFFSYPPPPCGVRLGFRYLPCRV